MTVNSDYVLSIGVRRHSTQIPGETGAIHFEFPHMLLCQSINSSFADTVLLFSFQFETATKAKFIFYPEENDS